MKFAITVKRVGDPKEEAWTETYEENTTDPQAWAEDTLAHFNKTLRSFESPRELLSVELLEDDNSGFHDWDKDVTKMSAIFKGKGNHNGQMYDGMYCRVCGITGKRFGLSSHIYIDSKYRKKAFRRCDTAQAELNKQREA